MDVQTVAEGFRAIDINLKGKLFAFWGGQGREKKYQVRLGENYGIQDEKELVGPTGGKEVHVIPVIKGAKSGWAKIIVGALLIAAAFTPLGAIAIGATKMTVGMVLLGAGVSLVLGGIVQLLTPVPNFNQNSGTDSGSKIFSGNATGAVQGGPVPIVYGRMLVSPTPISISMSNISSVTTKNLNVGTVNSTTLIGGGIQYSPGSDSGDQEGLD